MLAGFGSLPHLPSGSLPSRTRVRTMASAGEASAERSLLCLALPPPRLPARSRSAGRGGVASVAVHLVVASLVISLFAWSHSAGRLSATATTDSPQLPRMVFILQPAPGGGGGGGGNKQPEPPSRARAIGHDQLTVPVVKRAAIAPTVNEEAPRQQQVLLDAKPMGADATMMIGLPEASPSVPFSRGPGSGEGVGGGSGSGIGSGTGPGVGPGSGGGFGGGAYRPGGVVIPPMLLKQVTPRYTTNAMRERIQGMVALEVVINREGIPAAIRVTRSLDPGLDGEAIIAARQWRFAPGRIGDTPVDVLVTILLDFNVR